MNFHLRLAVCLVVLVALVRPGAADVVADWMAQRPELAGARWSLLVVDLADGRAVWSHDPDALLLPASNLKILTAAAVLEEPFPIPTSVVLDVNGDLVLRGGGDPSLSSADLDVLAASVAARTKSVRDVLLDERAVYGARLGPGWAWDDETEAYSAPLGALGVDENVLRARFSAALAPLAPPRVALSPPGVLEVENEASTGFDDTLSWERRGGRLHVRGTIPQAETIEALVTVDDPGTYAGTIFLRALEAHGVRVSGTLRRGGGFAPAFMWSHLSPAVPQLVRRMMKESDNYYAEQLLRVMGRGTDGIAEAASRLQKMGLQPGTWRQVDGSGLSRMNLLRASQIVTVLRAMASNRDFVQSLPIAGVDGTLAARFTSSPLRGRLLAKTGSMTGVSGLSGYVCDRNGKPRWAFSLLTNNYLARSVKKIEDELMERIFIPLLDQLKV